MQASFSEPSDKVEVNLGSDSTYDSPSPSMSQDKPLSYSSGSTFPREEKVTPKPLHSFKEEVFSEPPAKEPKEETDTVQETTDQSGTSLQNVMQQSEAEKSVEELPAIEPDREIARVAMEDSKQPERRVMTDEEMQKLSDERNAVLR